LLLLYTFIIVHYPGAPVAPAGLPAGQRQEETGNGHREKPI